MRELTKAQLTIGVLACFAIVWSLIQQALDSSEEVLIAFGIVVLQLVAIIIISIVLLGILEWIKVFDLKTNSILTLLVLITIELLLMV